MEQRLLIGISGFNASGKTTLARALIEHFKASSNRFSAVLATIAEELGLPTDKVALQELSTVLRARLGEDILARGMCEWVKGAQNPIIVVEGIRRTADIELLEKTARETGRTWHLFFTDAPYETRFIRINTRRQDEGLTPFSPEEFAAIENQECEIELPLIKKRAHVVLDNETLSSFESAKSALDHIQASSS